MKKKDSIIPVFLTSLLFIFLSCNEVSCAGTPDDPRQLAISNYVKYQTRAVDAPEPLKMEAISTLREYYQGHPQATQKDKSVETPEVLLELLSEDGTFSDFMEKERYLEEEDIFHKVYHNTPDDEVGIFITDAYRRIFRITSYLADNCTSGPRIPDKVWKAVLHYGNLEIGRPNDMPRFHASCFAIPAAASNIYFSVLEEMDLAESRLVTGNFGRSLETGKEDLRLQACEMLKTVALESWTQPLRRDVTDEDVVSLERFRKHVWWVGGNALAYRQLLPVAAMFSSVPMVDLIAEICRKCISCTSQTTVDESFWSEGFTADGAGWGHGRQCLVWGYPIDGTSSALKILSILKGTPWDTPLSKENVEALMQFFRGSSWYYRDGYRLPGLDRNSYVCVTAPKQIPFKKMLDNLIKNWSSSFDDAQLRELLQLQQEAAADHIRMTGSRPGDYQGIRWFYNNDDFIRSKDGCHVAVNMASHRCDGLESADFADNYNFFPTDGATLFQRSGNEYFNVMGGWDVTYMPGVTSRSGMDRLVPVTNWRGYCSRSDFAAACTDSSDLGVAGFIFEKMHGEDKSEYDGHDRENPMLYGFSVNKGYFFFGDHFIALGAGLEDEGVPYAESFVRDDILHTTIDQTHLSGRVTVRTGRKEKVLEKGEAIFTQQGQSPVWVAQDGGFSYCLLPDYGQKMHVSLETVPTDWIKRNPSNRKNAVLPDHADILKLWISHEDLYVGSVSPLEGRYGYAVYLGDGSAPSRLPFRVLSNDKDVQAVVSRDGKILQAIFYPGRQRLEVGRQIVEVSSPCALMIKSGKEGIALYVSDGQMDPELKEIKVTIGGRSWNVPLPQGERCGSVTSFPIIGLHR